MNTHIRKLVYTALFAALLGAVSLGVLALRQWRQRERDRLAHKEAAKAELERQVEERTAELREANRLVAAEESGRAFHALARRLYP